MDESLLICKRGPIKRPTNTEKLYNAVFALYEYHDGRVEIVKSRYGQTGEICLGEAIKYFSKILAELKLKDTQLDMFKVGLSQLIQESIENTLKGDFQNEGDICGKSSIDGT